MALHARDLVDFCHTLQTGLECVFFHSILVNPLNASTHFNQIQLTNRFNESYSQPTLLKSHAQKRS